LIELLNVLYLVITLGIVTLEIEKYSSRINQTLLQIQRRTYQTYST
jgi:hypothetical protein